jgi:NAD+ kinase
MKKVIRSVGLFGKYRDESVSGHVVALGAFLKKRGLTVVLDESTAELVPAGVAPVAPFHDICLTVDLAIVIGGDGTLLNAARSLAPCGVPIIGVNLGRLGFLTDVAADNMIDDIGKILDGDHHIERRLLLKAEVMRQGKIAHTANAFNDVVIGKGELARMIEFETYVGGEFVNDTRGDGLIVASPTGSTAYSLSAGGPILLPTMPAIVLVPICPHTLSHRPIVVPSNTTIEIVMKGATSQQAFATFDGQATFPLAAQDRIYVRRSESDVELLHPSNRSHFDAMRIKLGWGG